MLKVFEGEEPVGAFDAVASTTKYNSALTDASDTLVQRKLSYKGS